jgi:hypothetical protein
MRDRSKLMIAGALAIGLAAAQHPVARVQVLTHDIGDPSPRRIQAALDLGVVAVSVLVTWTGRHLGR